ncbi:protein FAR1-RELATED SEQUENCE 6-like [Aristolochia californica]|uniref:protein FAR1-RELATED SEQUENCE 6-like n=1 Tax=Aristolochia californica TaxID=171875 RepID=UPI0035DE4BDA
MADETLAEVPVDEVLEVNLEDESIHHDAIDDKTPKVGMVFQTYEEVLSFYKEYAMIIGFGVFKRSSMLGDDGKYETFTIACVKEGKPRRKPEHPQRCRPLTRENCPARIVARVQEDGTFKLTRVILEHSHEMSPSKSRCFKCTRVLDPHAKKQMENNNQEGIRPRKSSSYLTRQRRGLQNLPCRSKKCKDDADKAKRLRLGVGDAEAILQYFSKAQKKNPNFFHVVDIDESGHLRNVFWSDARSRVAYQYFGDVISFDTTYLTNGYDIPLTSFIGVNHHGQSVLLGCGFLSGGSTENYMWLFKCLLECMSGWPPLGIITDNSKALLDAVTQVFPQAQHRLCLWHIMKKIPDKFKAVGEYKEIKKAMKKAIYGCLTVEEFESDWKNMVEQYNLHNNEWLLSLYENRHHWVPVYVKDKFWAGISPVQQFESVKGFFDGYAHAKTSLKQFMEVYDLALQNAYEKEAEADYCSFHISPPLISSFHMERQLSEWYTNNMFKQFQDEVKALMYCTPSLVRVDDAVAAFEVKERRMVKEGTKMEHLKYEVLYNANEMGVVCICRSFEFRGILCRHALSVLNFQEVDCIPPQYILPRWRKDLKRKHALFSSSLDVILDNEMERYKNLYGHCIELAEIGATSKVVYKVVLNELSALKEKVLKDPSMCQTTLSNLDPSLAQSVENGDKVMGSSHDEFLVRKVLVPRYERKRSRLATKRKQSTVEDENVGNDRKQMVTQGEPNVDDENHVSPFVPNTSDFGTHFESESIQLANSPTESLNGNQTSQKILDGYNPSDVSLEISTSPHYGLEVTMEDHIDITVGRQVAN